MRRNSCKVFNNIKIIVRSELTKEGKSFKKTTRHETYSFLIKLSKHDFRQLYEELSQKNFASFVFLMWRSCIFNYLGFYTICLFVCLFVFNLFLVGLSGFLATER